MQAQAQVAGTAVTITESERAAFDAVGFLSRFLGNDEEQAMTVFVVESQPQSQRSLTWILRSAGFDVVDYRSGEDFLAGFDGDTAGCLLVNLRLPGMSGVAVLEELGRRGVVIPVILMTGYGEAIAAVEAFRSGAFDVVDEAFDMALIERVRHALGADVRRRQRSLARAEMRARLSSLTAREREIADLLTKGCANKVIAYDLGISERTVECHRARIMQKIGARSVVDLVRVVLVAADLDDAIFG